MASGPLAYGPSQPVLATGDKSASPSEDRVELHPTALRRSTGLPGGSVWNRGLPCPRSRDERLPGRHAPLAGGLAIRGERGGQRVPRRAEHPARTRRDEQPRVPSRRSAKRRRRPPSEPPLGRLSGRSRYPRPCDRPRHPSDPTERSSLGRWARRPPPSGARRGEGSTSLRVADQGMHLRPGSHRSDRMATRARDQAAALRSRWEWTARRGRGWPLDMPASCQCVGALAPRPSSARRPRIAATDGPMAPAAASRGRPGRSRSPDDRRGRSDEVGSVAGSRMDRTSGQGMSVRRRRAAEPAAHAVAPAISSAPPRSAPGDPGGPHLLAHGRRIGGTADSSRHPPMSGTVPSIYAKVRPDGFRRRRGVSAPIGWDGDREWALANGYHQSCPMGALT